MVTFSFLIALWCQAAGGTEGGKGRGRPAWEDVWGPQHSLDSSSSLPTGGTVALSVILHALPTGGQSEYKH